MWGTGLVLYTIVILLTIIGIGDTRWLGRGMQTFFYLYNLGYMLVFIGQSRSVIYNSNEILIKETSGYIRKYAVEDIDYISELKKEKYRIVFKDDFAQYIGIRNEYQKNILKELAGGAFEADIYYD